MFELPSGTFSFRFHEFFGDFCFETQDDCDFTNFFKIAFFDDFLKFQVFDTGRKLMVQEHESRRINVEGLGLFLTIRSASPVQLNSSNYFSTFSNFFSVAFVLE